MNIDKSMIPSLDDMIFHTVQALYELGGKASVDELNRRTLQLMAVPTEVKSLRHTNNGSDHRTEIEYRLAWARTYLKQYGLLSNPARGVWQLTDVYDNDEGIVPGQIIKAVRRRRFENFKEDNSTLSPPEKARAFERFALSALENYAQRIGKTVESGTVSYGFGYYAVMPLGILGTDQKTYIEIRLSPIKEKLFSQFREIPADEQLLIIIGDTLSNQSRQNMETAARTFCQCSVLIWDYNDLISETGCELDSAQYLDEPKKALIEDAFRNTPSPEERARTKAARIRRLKEQYQRENVTLLLGAGVSISAGLPRWTTLIHQMLTTMICNKLNEEQPLSDAERTAISQLAENNQESTPLTQVRYISSGMEPEEFRRVVRENLYRKLGDYKADRLLNAIAVLSKPVRNHKGLKSIITYNFDDLLEHKLSDREIGYHIISDEKDIPDPNVLNIYHVHGYLPQEDGPAPDSDAALVFSEEEYHELYRNVYSWSNLTQLNAFRETTCLFVGSSLEDPNLRRLLDVYRRSCDEPRHYAVLVRKTLKKTDDIQRMFPVRLDEYREIDNNIRDHYFESIGINVIWVDDYDEIPDVLKEISGKRI